MAAAAGVVGSSSSQHTQLSWLRPGEEGRSPCGYCGSKDDTSISLYMSAISLDVVDYQALLDRGWRRSGTLLYLPVCSTALEVYHCQAMHRPIHRTRSGHVAHSIPFDWRCPASSHPVASRSYGGGPSRVAHQHANGSGALRSHRLPQCTP